MNCLLKVAVVYLCITQFICVADDSKEVGKCRYYNDPHLIPFPVSPGASQEQYICRNNCTEILLKNDFVEIIVTPDPAGDYPIVAYTLIFFATGGYSFPCVITNSIASPSASLTCPPGTPASTIMTGSGQFHTHLTENIQVDITTRGAHFNIEITQSFDLISQSEGVCIKWDCEFEYKIGKRRRRQASADSLIDQICGCFIDAGREQALGEVNIDYLKYLRVACVYDINTTFDHTVMS
ncbi:unnamed protein product [Rotaria sp. Silwood1]|nr:unnamed protein product [Rotaria sp. Silwood1]CAF1422315.1 unnamed protein product [Rotaria sp. Silwood1]CAF3537124.1 unnamed protein product [Rotaria sp. Silwood1]CAF3563656.1 unnamed protein product [Rotaria sp. Silwood1]CAF4855041.1 unnamed protein product [Rotaria sp. Silwood1]